MKSSNRINPVQVLLLACAVVCSAPAVALDESQPIEEIIVTADFREASAAKLPASVSVIRPNDEGTVVNHLEEILGRAPNVNFASGASRGRFIQIRGIGERGQFAAPLNTSVGMVVDGVDISGIGTAATLFDVAQVEILRGPQGTLYGSNALAGLINIVTPQPTLEPDATLRLDTGDYGAFGMGAVVSGPIGDDFGYRVSAQRFRDDGFMDNQHLGRDNTNNHDERTYRGKFTWSSAIADWQLVLGRVEIENGYDAFSLDNDRTTLSDQPGQDVQRTDYGSLSLTSELTDAVMFQGTLGFASSDISYGYDEDWTFAGFDPIGYTSTDQYDRDRDTLSLDARWLSVPGEGLFAGAWDWVAGIYLLRQEVDLTRTYTFFAGPFESDYEIERLAAYGELSRELDERWRLTIGGRYERVRADYTDNASVAFDPDDGLFGGRILLERSLDRGGLLYAGVTQGYKASGFNLNGTLPADLREYDEETLWNVEVGYKTRLLDERLGLRAAIFRMQRNDIQISTSTERFVSGNSGPVEFIVYTGNAAEGYNQGIELEVDYLVTASLALFANVGLLDTEYQDFVDNSGRDLDGRDQAHAPGYQFFAGAQYALNDRLIFSIEVEGKDDFYFSASHPEQSSSYELLNASVTYEVDQWRLRLWGRNLTDEDYRVRGFFFGNDPRDFYTARAFTQLGEPRQIGLSIQYDF